MVNIDISSAVNIGGALIGITIFTMFGQLVAKKAKYSFFWGGVFAFALPYGVSVMRLFQGLFDLMDIIPIVGVFLKDLPDIFALLLNIYNIQHAFPIAIFGALIARFFFGALIGGVFDSMNMIKKMFGESLSMVAKLLIGVLTFIFLLIVFMLMAYVLSSTGCAFISSLCLLNQGIYVTLIPLAVLGTFIANMGAFISTIVSIFRRGEGGIGWDNFFGVLKGNASDILSAMFIVAVYSMTVLLPIIAPMSGTALNLW